MRQASKHYRNALFFLLLLISLFSRITRPGLRAEEPRRAMVAIETFELAPHGVPKINGEPYLNKPPLYIWLQGGLIQIAGSSVPVVRIPGLVFFLLSALLLYVFVRQYGSVSQSVKATIIYLTAGDLLFYGSVYSGEMDLFYAFLMFAQLVWVFQTSRNKQWWLMYMGWYALSLAGLLSKGLPSLHFHLSYFLLLIWQHRSWRPLFHPAHLLGLFILSGGLCAFFEWYEQYGNARLYFLSLLGESLEKSAVSYQLKVILLHALKFPLNFLLLLLPWSLIPMIRKMPRWKVLPEALRFSLLFCLINISIYWVSPGNHNRYLYMFIPPAMMFLAYMLEMGAERKTPTVSLRWLPLLGAFILAAFYFFRPEVNAIPALIFLMISLIILAAARTPALTAFWRLSFFLLLMRIGMNELYLPVVAAETETARYIQHSQQLNKLCKGQPISLEGPWNIDSLRFKKAGLQWKETKKVPPLLPYQIPYYYYRQSGQMILFQTDAPFALMHQSALQAGDYREVLYTFADEWNKQDMVVIERAIH